MLTLTAKLELFLIFTYDVHPVGWDGMISLLMFEMHFTFEFL